MRERPLPPIPKDVLGRVVCGVARIDMNVKGRYKIRAVYHKYVRSDGEIQSLVTYECGR